jgi:hypothetical protein
MHCVMSIGRRVRACTRLLVAAKALATRDYVRGISRLSTLPNTCPKASKTLTALLLTTLVYPSTRCCSSICTLDRER